MQFHLKNVLTVVTGTNFTTSVNGPSGVALGLANGDFDEAREILTGEFNWLGDLTLPRFNTVEAADELVQEIADRHNGGNVVLTM